MTATAVVVGFVVSCTPMTVVVASCGRRRHYPDFWRPNRRHDEKPPTGVQPAGGLSSVGRRAPLKADAHKAPSSIVGQLGIAVGAANFATQSQLNPIVEQAEAGLQATKEGRFVDIFNGCT